MPRTVNSNNVGLYFRIYPLKNEQWQYVKILKDRKTIYVRYRQELTQLKLPVVPKYWRFCSNYVFYNSTQAEIFIEVMSGVLENVISGQNAIIMAYGQTGCGKSTTINGITYLYEDRGILPRVVLELFRLKEAMPKHIKVCVKISYIEINRSQIKDLLKPYPDNILNSLKNVTKLKVENEDQTMRSIFIGEARKDFSKNAQHLSHRANSIFTFRLTVKNARSRLTPTTSLIHIIDLAGADTAGNITCLFKEPHEIGSGNLAKTQLEQFLLVLSDGIPEFIKAKQRTNPIIEYLGNSLSYSSILRFIGHVRTDNENILITLSMLRFGQLMGGLKPMLQHVKMEDGTKEKLEDMKKDIDFFGPDVYSGICKSPERFIITQERHNYMQRTVEEYLQDKITAEVLVQLADINVAMEILKTLYNEKESTLVQEISLKANKRASSTSLKKFSRLSATAEGSMRESKQTLSDRNTIKSQISTKSVRRLSSANKSKPLEKELTIPKLTSASSLKKSQTSRRKSSTATDISLSTERRDSKQLFKSKSVLLFEIPPDHSEAWKEFVSCKVDEYKCILTQYKDNEALTTSTYNVYLEKVDLLQQALANLEQRKTELLQASMTKKYQLVDQFDEAGNELLSRLELLCTENVNRAEIQTIELQECVLQMQSELRQHIKIGKGIKDDVKNQFDDFCREKYQLPLPNLSIDQNIEQDVGLTETQMAKEKSQILEEISEKEKFECMKKLFDEEMNKINLYKATTRKWTKLYK